MTRLDLNLWLIASPLVTCLGKMAPLIELTLGVYICVSVPTLGACVCVCVCVHQIGSIDFSRLFRGGVHHEVSNSSLLEV
jgi:hypothetical protein